MLSLALATNGPCSRCTRFAHDLKDGFWCPVLILFRGGGGEGLQQIVLGVRWGLKPCLAKNDCMTSDSKDETVHIFCKMVVITLTHKQAV
jgi:hypothetical protein